MEHSAKIGASALASADGALYIAPTMDETRLKRIAFRAWRRGFREADLILGPFTDRYCPDMTTAELDIYEALLDELDHDIYDWLIERRPVPPELDTAVFRKLQDFQRNLPVAGGDLSGS